MTMEIGLSTGFYYEQDIRSVLSQVAEAGFSWIEIWAGPHKWKGNYVHFDWREAGRCGEVRRILEELGLKVWSIHCPYASGLDPAHPEENLRRAAAEEVMRSLPVAAELGARFAVFHPSSAKWTPTDDERRLRMESLRRSAGEIVEASWHLGVTAAVENLLPHLFGGEPEVVMETLRFCGPDGLVACFDSSHANLWKTPTVYEICDQIGPHIRTVHLSDNLQEHDDHFIFGRGTIDWPRLLGRLKSAGYGGLLMCEVHGEARGGEPRQKLLQVRRKAEELAVLYDHLEPAGQR